MRRGSDCTCNHMSLTCILIDFENVHPPAADMSSIRGADYRVRFFHGSHQNKFDADMVKAGAAWWARELFYEACLS